MAAALGQLIQEEHPVVRERHLARHRHVAPADPPRVGMVWWGVWNGRAVTNAVRPPVSPAMR
jgi:hypothetical protein